MENACNGNDDAAKTLKEFYDDAKKDVDDAYDQTVSDLKSQYKAD